METPRDARIDDPVAEWLYPRWWCGSDEASVALGADPLIGGLLETARRSVTPVETAYLVLASDAAQLVAARTTGSTRGTLVRRAADAVVGSSRPGMPPRPGDLVDLLAGVGEVDRDGAWWWAHTGEQPISSFELDRWYVNVAAADAPRLVAATVRLAATTGVPLSLKCPARAGGFDRRDALVVYAPRADARRLQAALPGWLDEVSGALNPDEPPLTRRLHPGVGVAQDPGGGISYGQLRCAQIASAVGRAFDAARGDLARAERLVAGDGVSLLADVGIRAERPEEVAA
ncbi:T3SS effector HopA1 family protein [Intrasporangium oryzae]|nr:T3SS effector HopA1 family protein [Intrasporangium oryzae]